MTLSSGARLGPYEILAAIGAGGMGEVCKARDTRLDRTVAIKVLPPRSAPMDSADTPPTPAIVRAAGVPCPRGPFPSGDQRIDAPPSPGVSSPVFHPAQWQSEGERRRQHAPSHLLLALRHSRNRRHPGVRRAMVDPARGATAALAQAGAAQADLIR